MLPLLITPGDAAGIGPEIALKAYTALKDTLPLQCVGPEWIWKHAAARFSLPEPDTCYHVESLNAVLPGEIIYGQTSAALGTVAVECVKAAASACIENKAIGVITAPLTKTGIHAAGYDYAGHTNLLAEMANTPHHAMMLATNELRVILVTHHIRLSDVMSSINSDAVHDKIVIAHETGRRCGIPEPRIAVCGLNPHAGEGGAFGDEEQTVIYPAIQRAAEQQINASGPYPADSIFYRARRGEFDFVIAMYHDQGLIPIKLGGFSDVVNTTLGLPFIRTSPGHGSAYDIAGTGCADPSSMHAAIIMAAQQAGIQ
jgi:4-hydroxythreonine-4-phosphate dehydrogenase